MSTHDMSIANQTFPAFRADLNSALGALASSSSNTSEPPVSYAHQVWANATATDTTLKIRNKANNAWVTIGTIAESTNTFTSGTASSAAAATYASNVTVQARDTTNAVHYLTFTTAQTGNIPVYTDVNLTYNPSTNVLATSISGNANTATSATSASSAGTCTGNSATATKLSTDRTNWNTNSVSASVVGQLGWQKNGNNSTIFDASNNTNPQGTSLGTTGTSDKNAAVAWTVGYPVLMGWNGTQTYGVRVDSARVADSAGSAGSATSATTASKVVVANDIESAERAVLFASSDSSTSTAVLANDDITYNPSTKTLTVQNLSGNALTATSANSATTAGSANTAGSADTAGVATKVEVDADTDEETTTVRYITFVGSTTADSGILVDAGLTYNAQDNKLTASIFKGDLDGNAKTATSAGSADTAGTATTATNANKLNITADNTGTTARPILFSAAATGNQDVYSDTSLSYIPSSNTLSCSIFSGNVSGNLTGDVTGNVSGSSGSCTGNSATATKLLNTRKINNVDFNGTVDITIADSTKLPAAGGTITGTTESTSSTTGALKVSGGVGIAKNLYVGGIVSASSDRRIKTNITTIDNALSTLFSINGVYYDRIDLNGPRQAGVIAQDVLKKFPVAVSGSEDTTYSVQYNAIIGLLIEAVKELKQELDELKGR